MRCIKTRAEAIAELGERPLPIAVIEGVLAAQTPVEVQSAEAPDDAPPEAETGASSHIGSL